MIEKKSFGIFSIFLYISNRVGIKLVHREHWQLSITVPLPSWNTDTPDTLVILSRDPPSWIINQSAKPTIYNYPRLGVARMLTRVA